MRRIAVAYTIIQMIDILLEMRRGVAVGCTHCNGRRYLALPEGLEITEVMRLASYSKYDTTLKNYPAVKDDLVDRARRAVGHRVSREMLEKEV